MEERRKYQRVNAERRIDGEVILESDIKIVDISLSGILFLCSRQILTNSKYSIQLNLPNDEKVLTIKGKVVRSIFKGINKVSMDKSPVYEVAMEFTDLSDDQINLLTRIKSILK